MDGVDNNLFHFSFKNNRYVFIKQNKGTLAKVLHKNQDCLMNIVKEEVRSSDTWALRKAVILLNARQLFITWFKPSSAAGTPCALEIFAIRVQPDVREKIGLFALVNDLNSRKSNCCSCCIGLDTRSYSNEVKVELPSIPVGSFARTWSDLLRGQNWLGF